VLAQRRRIGRLSIGAGLASAMASYPPSAMVQCTKSLDRRPGPAYIGFVLRCSKE
jgi:hypothetical protein